MKTQHTAGPWIIQEHKDKNFGIDLTEGKKGKVICNVTSHYIAEHEEAQANARLIAAAPELLAALQDLVAISKHPYQEMATYKYAQEIIKKAKGE